MVHFASAELLFRLSNKHQDSISFIVSARLQMPMFFSAMKHCWVRCVQAVTGCKILNRSNQLAYRQITAVVSDRLVVGEHFVHLLLSH